MAKSIGTILDFFGALDFDKKKLSIFNGLLSLNYNIKLINLKKNERLNLAKIYIVAVAYKK